ncbi:MAG: alpha/beta fold hydrolase, partial [Chloroflexota bacterium]
MRFLSRLSLLLVLLIPLAIHAQSESDVDAAKAVFAKFVSGDFTGIYDQVGDQIKSAVSADQLDQAWQGIIATEGAFQQISDVNAGPVDHSVVLTLQFEKGQLNFLVGFDTDGKIVGLRFVPVTGAPTLVAPTPTYADMSAFTETAVTVGDLSLRGTITMPNASVGAGPFPAVVLIAGSGAEDQDETVGPNKPLRDIAWGLAAQGIATIRYDKRTYQPKTTLDIKSFTVKEEYLDDALAAIHLVSTTDGIDPAKVFILGHSLGGYVLPRIAQADPTVAGMIIASGLATSLQEAILRQTQYNLSLSEVTPAPDATEDPQITAIQSLIDQINALTADSPNDKLLLGAAPAYWLDLRDYDPAALAASLPQPILILQGERDYQVTVADDLAAWKAGLADHADTTVKTYP